MLEIKNKLQELLKVVYKKSSLIPEDVFSKKSTPNKWSKKEILGHLIDSGINNPQRFTEIQFESKPYKLRNYHQNKLVIANDYQNVNTKDLLQL